MINNAGHTDCLLRKCLQNDTQEKQTRDFSWHVKHSAPKTKISVAARLLACSNKTVTEKFPLAFKYPAIVNEIWTRLMATLSLKIDLLLIFDLEKV